MKSIHLIIACIAALFCFACNKETAPEENTYTSVSVEEFAKRTKEKKFERSRNEAQPFEIFAQEKKMKNFFSQVSGNCSYFKKKYTDKNVFSC